MSALDIELAENFVDDALRAAAGREVLIRSEALEVLRGAETSIAYLALGDVSGIVEQMESDTLAQTFVPRTDVVNALLDIRLAIRH